MAAACGRYTNPLHQLAASGGPAVRAKERPAKEPPGKGPPAKEQSVSDDDTTPDKSSGGKKPPVFLQTKLRKTKMCAYHVRGLCQWGSDCAFAHSNAELQANPDLRKTRLCKAFEEGHCNSRIKDCPFAHGEEDLRFHKYKMCAFFEKGECRNGYSCRFAHGGDELRAFGFKPLPSTPQSKPREERPVRHQAPPQQQRREPMSVPQQQPQREQPFAEHGEGRFRAASLVDEWSVMQARALLAGATRALTGTAAEPAQVDRFLPTWHEQQREQLPQQNHPHLPRGAQKREQREQRFPERAATQVQEACSAEELSKKHVPSLFDVLRALPVSAMNATQMEHFLQALDEQQQQQQQQQQRQQHTLQQQQQYLTLVDLQQRVQLGQDLNRELLLLKELSLQRQVLAKSHQQAVIKVCENMERFRQDMNRMTGHFSGTDCGGLDFVGQQYADVDEFLDKVFDAIETPSPHDQSSSAGSGAYSGSSKASWMS